jgi:hypothetical protein
MTEPVDPRSPAPAKPPTGTILGYEPKRAPQRRNLYDGLRVEPEAVAALLGILYMTLTIPGLFPVFADNRDKGFPSRWMANLVLEVIVPCLFGAAIFVLAYPATQGRRWALMSSAILLGAVVAALLIGSYVEGPESREFSWASTGLAGAVALAAIVQHLLCWRESRRSNF